MSDAIICSMISKDFRHVRAWVFDLDNTLYHPSARLFDQMEVKMTAWVMRTLMVDKTEADRLRSTYWQLHGTTLAGLMSEHGIDPVPYLDDVHDISLSHLTADAELARLIGQLPGRRIVYTNGTAPYAERVLEARGLSGLFNAVYGVENAGYLPKPERAAFDAIFAADKLDPSEGAMFEDDARNLAVPHALGMKTVHVAEFSAPAPHIHHHTDDLTHFLGQVLESDRAE